MTSSLEAKDTLIVIAFPDFYIYYPDTWHKPISQSIGIVQGDKVLAGHSCALLIDHKTSEVNYYDFGRYAVPSGKGRARSAITDPELALQFKAMQSKTHALLNLNEIIANFAQLDAVHHGAGPMYYKVITKVDGNKVKEFVQEKTSEGFIPYEIFGMKSLNCSRYIYQLIKQVVAPERLTAYFKYICPSATPLDNVMHVDVSEPVYKFLEGNHDQIEYDWLDSITYYFKKRKGYNNNTSRATLSDLKWIGSHAIGSYFKLQETGEHLLYNLLKYDQSGNFIWSRLFKASATIHLEDYSIALGNNPDHFLVTSEMNTITLMLYNNKEHL